MSPMFGDQLPPDLNGRVVGQREDVPLPPDLAEWIREMNELPHGLEHRRALPDRLIAAPPVETAAALRELDRPHVTGDGEVMCWCRPFRTATMWVHHDSRVPMGHGIIVPLEGGYAMGGKPSPGTKKDKRLKKNKKKG